jgi:hypothetical protein
MCECGEFSTGLGQKITQSLCSTHWNVTYLTNIIYKMKFYKYTAYLLQLSK